MPTTIKPHILSVSQITQALKNCIESSFPLLAVRGEMSNFKRQASGHLYFTLKDQHAQISAVLFRNRASSLRQMPKDGDQVIVTGRITLYPPRGNYQFQVETVEWEGIGELLRRLEELKAELKRRGWFDAEHKKPLPKFPKVIGVVTSPTGAALQDILNVLTRRAGGFHLILHPVRVQGKEAPAEIAKAIDEFNQLKLADVLIVGRGGGSIEDLWAFNEEAVAKAIFASNIPIISAVGHESDFTLADFVADVRAPTPSTAAEIVTAEADQHLKLLSQIVLRIQQHAKHAVEQQQLTLDDLMERLDRTARQSVAQKKHTLLLQQKHFFSLNPKASCARIRKELHIWRQRSLDALLGKLTHLRHLLSAETTRRHAEQRTHALLCSRKESFHKLKMALQSVDPRAVLRRGYSLLFSEKEGRVVTSTAQLSAGMRVQIQLTDGKAKAMVEEVEST